MTPKVASIIVNWNGGSLAVDCVRSLASQTVEPSIWVVDNASADGSAEAIANAATVHPIQNTQNVGYASANNQAMRQCMDADYLLLINNDVILPEADGLERVIRAMEGDPSIQGACGRYEYPDGDFQHFYNQLPTATDLMTIWGVLKHIRFFQSPARFARYYSQNIDFTKPTTLQQPAFSCVLLRGGAARAVGLMDEAFPIIFNDIDYCWRFREQGWVWDYFPGWRIIHHKSRSTSKIGGKLQAEFFSATVHFARKHFNPLTALFVTATVTIEAAWRRFRHGEKDISLAKTIGGSTYFGKPAMPLIGSAPSLDN